jgi:thioredoxin-like negative regulator of GroEL
MPFLTDDDHSLLEERFSAELTEPVKVMLFSEKPSGLYVPGARTCESCKDAEELLTEVASLSSNFELEIHDVKAEPDVASKWQVTETPTTAIVVDGEARARFLGLPVGYEFASFLESLLSAPSKDFRLQPESIERLSALTEPVDLKVFSTPT